MYTRRNIRWTIIFSFARVQLMVFIAWSTVVTLIHILLQQYDIDGSLPLAPLGTIGVAVALYVGFKNNQSYDRSWEARKIWGGIINVSRAWGNHVINYVSAFHAGNDSIKTDIKLIWRELIYRHLAWINSVRYQLRRVNSFGFEPTGAARKFMQPTDIEALKRQINEFLPEEEVRIACQQANTATQILRRQGERLKEIYENERVIEDFRHIALMDLITEMHALQGKCERIKNTPFPRQYAYFSTLFTWIFVVLLPFGIVGELADRGAMIWLTIPLSVIISWIFATMETVGDTSEDPFENFINDVPMTALCTTIEIDLRQMLGEENIPEPKAPVDDVLM